MDRYNLGIRGGEESGLEPLPVGLQLSPYTTSAVNGPRNFRGNVSIRIGLTTMKIEDALDCLPGGGNNTMFPILITNGLLWQPANNARNLLASALWRTHNDPFVGFPPFAVRFDNWHSLQNIYEKLIYNWVDHLLTVEECADLMGQRGKRILAAYQKVKEGNLKKHTKTITLKWNETLPVDKDCNGVITMKPRAIINLDPRIHALMAPFSRAMTDVMHEIFDGKFHSIGKYSVRIFFAAGSTHEQLSELGNALNSSDIVIAASGDDSVVAWGGYPLAARSTFSEADQSQFDHTQDEGPLSLACFWMRKLGAPEEFLDLVKFCCRSDYTSRKHDFSSTGGAGTQMPTGITLTTLLNSMATIAMYLFTIANESTDLVHSARQLGFKVKLVNCDDIRQLTFLKGWWVDSLSVGELIWLPLPSAVVKLGKLLKDPCLIFKDKNPHSSYSKACYALAKSYGQVPFEYPILGVFLKQLLYCSSQGLYDKPVHGLAVLESWKPVVQDYHIIDVDSCRAAMCARYDITRSDIERVEKLIRKVRSVPCYLEDPVFLSLSITDY